MAELRIKEVDHEYVWEDDNIKNPIVRDDQKTLYPLVEMDDDAWAKTSHHFRRAMMQAWIEFWKDKEATVNRGSHRKEG